MIYKYCRIDGFDIVTNSRLRLSRIDRLNDPFELAFGIDEDTAYANIKHEYAEDPNLLNLWRSVLGEHGIIHDGTSPADILVKFTEFQISDFRRLPKILCEHWNGTMGIACMSEAMDVVQMWAHYTDNHKGIVVGLEESEFVWDREAVITVCYRDRMVLLPVSGHPAKLDEYATTCFREVVARKETHWGYEKEIRLYGILQEQDPDGNYYLTLPKSAIKEVYLGLRSDDTTIALAECIKQRDDYRHLRIFKMRRHESAFKLEPYELL